MPRLPKTYFIIVIAFSLLPLTISLYPAATSLFFRWIKPIPQYSEPNLDEGNSYTYSLSGRVINYLSVPNRREIFLKLYSKDQYQIADFLVTFPRQIKLIPIREDGTFSATNLPGGDYLLSPQTDPQHGLFFPRDYPLTLNRRNISLLVEQPVTSPAQFLILRLSNLLLTRP